MGNAGMTFKNMQCLKIMVKYLDHTVDWSNSGDDCHSGAPVPGLWYCSFWLMGSLNLAPKPKWNGFLIKVSLLSSVYFHTLIY